MLRVEVNWIWETQSPMHCGSGLSEPGYADRLVQTDAQGKPALLGDAVKGALRMSAEQVLSWLKANDARYNKSSHTGTAEPQHPLLIALFGGTGHQHYRPGKLSNPDRVSKAVSAATAIDRVSGRAKDDTLRYVESVSAGARFECGCTLWLENPNLLDPSITLLLAALAATESIGAKAGIGWGRVKPDGVRVEVMQGGGAAESATPVDCDAALAPDRLDQLASGSVIASPADGEGSEGEQAASAALSVTPVSGPLQWWKLTLHLEEPTCVGSRPDVSNKVATLDAIPATTLRGALRSAWLRRGINEDEILALLGSDSRWTPAVPAVAVQGSLVPCVPVPLSFAREKEEAGFGSSHGVHDNLSGCRPPETHKADPKQPLQWRPLGEGWMYVEPADPQPPRLQPSKTHEHKEMRMHVARDYVTGSKRTGALFAREALVPTSADRGYVAYVGLPAAVVVQWPADLFVGKRTSAGNGRTHLSALRVTGTQRPWPDVWFSSQVALTLSHATGGDPVDRDTDVLVQLLSAAIVRDGKGLPLRTLGLKDWAQLLWPPPAQAPDGWASSIGFLQRTAPQAVPSWMTPWKHGRAAVTCIAAGSVWRLRCKDKSTAAAVRARLANVACEGLGERNHEGFGWFAVDPPWLGHWCIAEGTPAGGEKPPTSSRRAWPGCENVPFDAVAEIVRNVREITLRPEARSPLQELASRARGATAEYIRDTLLPFCNRMAERPRESNRWKYLKTGATARQILDHHAAAPDLFRFAIEALLIRATPEKEVSE